MKKKSHAYWVAALSGLSLLTSQAWADRVGNGGVGVVCRSSQGKILSAEMLDIFEGKNLDQNPLVYADNGLDLDTRIQLAMVQMVSNAKFLQDFQAELARVKVNIVILPDVSVGLTPTNDAFPTLYKKGCAFEQIANYMDDGKIRVDREIYNHLDTLNRAALYVHETVYSVARTNVGETNSIRSRKVTAQVLAKNSDFSVIRELMEQLVTPPKPPEPEGTHWAQVLWEGTYQADGGYCPIRIQHYDTDTIFGTFVGENCRSPGDSAKLYFSLNSRVSYSSTGYCNSFLHQIEIVDAATFVATNLTANGPHCSDKSYSTVYRRQ